MRKPGRKALAVLLALVLLVSVLPIGAQPAQAADLEKDGDVYLINDADDLQKFADKVNRGGETDADARLTADINLSGKSWTPIGGSNNPYTGTFDGNGKTISGLNINDNYQGLFGYLGSGGKIENLTVIGTVSGAGTVGGIVARNDGTIQNCTFSGTVSGNTVGGVVGYNNGGTVTGCYFLQGAAEKGIGNSIGGSATELTAEDFKSKDSFTAWTDFDTTWSISGILGRPVLKSNPQGGLGTKASPYQISTADELKNFATAVNSENGDTDACAVLMENIDLSEICGKDAGESGEGVSWTPIGNFRNPYSGTFDGNGKTIENLYIKNTSSDTDYQGLFGYVGTNGKIENLTVEGSITVTGGLSDVSVGGVVGQNSGSVTNCTNTSNITTTADHSTDSVYVGGVVCCNSGSVTNCANTENINVTVDVGTGDVGVGGVVCQNSGKVTNCTNTDTIIASVSSTGSVYVGGVVGRNENSVINCYNTGDVSGSKYVGGVVGGYFGSGSVENCYNTGEVDGPDSATGDVGGIVGYVSRGGVSNCYNTGSVSGSGNVGGVVGWNLDASVANCYFLQTADVNKNLQGIGVGSGDANEKDDTAFHSGEVTYLLGAAWGQNLKDGKKDNYPQLRAFDADTPQVYKVAFMNDSTEHDAKYANKGMSVDLPATNPTKDGYTFTGWLDANNQQVSGQTVTITADTKFTAQWQQNISVTAPSFTAITEGDPQPAAKPLTITNSGNTAATISSVALSDANAFSLNKTDGTTIAAEATDNTYTIQPAANLAAGTYTATITVTYDNGVTATAEVSFTVKEPEDPDDNPSTPSGPSTPSKPSGPSTGDSTGWADILDELENAENGDKITIDMGDETEVPAEIFTTIAGKDVDVIFDLGDVQWSASGENIPTDAAFTDINLGVALGTSGIPVNVINTITGEVGTVQITLAHNGEFGFTLTLTAPLGKENAGYWANLYHFDESAEALNFEAAAKIDEDGSVSIPFSHASQYAIVIDTHSHARVAVSDIFTDVAPDAWYTAAIQYAYDNRLMTGVSDTEFAPNATTTRAMIVSILARLENVTSAESAGFTDVSDEWYATAVNWAASENIVAGFEDGTFRPNAAITREQLAAILMNYAACIGQDVSNRADLANYTDQPSTWATETMQWAVAEGLISGVTNTELQPQGNATRAQVAAILQRFLEA